MEVAKTEDNMMTMEVQCTFKTSLPDKYQLPENTQISLSAGSSNKDLTGILKQLLGEEDSDLESELKDKKFNFMVGNTFLSTTLQELMEDLSISNETLVEIIYLFALDKPKPTHCSQEEEWISSIKSLTHIMNQKPKSYAVAFFNGDLKVYDSKHAELLKVNNLHPDCQITDLLYFKSDVMNKKIVVTASELPTPQLTFSELSQDKKNLNVIARAKSQFTDVNDGYSLLAQNPAVLEQIASASQVVNDPEQGICLWEVNPESDAWGEGGARQIEGSLKRQKTGVA